MLTHFGPRDLRFLVPLTKIEPQPDGKLLIEGVATSEAVDLMGEVVDFSSAREAFGSWRGNIREQHDPTKAVGHAIEVMPDEGAKQIVLRSFVSAGAPDTQAKVLDGTLGFYSIGGRTKAVALDKALKAADGKPARRLFMERISEVSLVDSGCNPDSAVSVLKATGIEEIEKINAPKIEEKDGKFLVVDSDGKVYGTHDTKEEAKAQLAALYANKGDVMAQPDEKFKALIEKYDGFEIADARTALEALDLIGSLINLESSEEHAEPPEQLALLKDIYAKLKAFIASEIQETEEEPVAMADDTGAKDSSTRADGSGDPTPPVATEPPPVVKQEDTPPPEPGEEPEPEPEPVVPEPPAVPPETEKAVTEPAKDDGLVMKGLVEKVEAMTGELATLKADLVTNKADLVTKGEENATLRKQVGDLQATVEKLGKRVVEPGTPVFKGPDGKPTTQPQGTMTDGAISVEKITELVKAANGDPAVLQRSLGMEIAQAQVRKALTGRQ
jgi:hypothetical protein